MAMGKTQIFYGGPRYVLWISRGVFHVKHGGGGRKSLIYIEKGGPILWGEVSFVRFIMQGGVMQLRENPVGGG